MKKTSPSRTLAVPWLDEALIGGREKPTIVIADYAPRWPAQPSSESWQPVNGPT